MVFQKITHTVIDFEKWSKGYKDNGSFRKSYSCIGTKVYTEVGNKNRVTAIMEWSDKGKMEQFGQSPGLKEAMKHAGVTSPPDLSFSETNDFNLSNFELQFETEF